MKLPEEIISPSSDALLVCLVVVKTRIRLGSMVVSGSMAKELIATWSVIGAAFGRAFQPTLISLTFSYNTFDGSEEWLLAIFIYIGTPLFLNWTLCFSFQLVLLMTDFLKKCIVVYCDRSVCESCMKRVVCLKARVTCLIHTYSKFENCKP